MALYINTDQILAVENLKDENGNTVTGATVEATVYESDGTTEVSGMTFPVSLSDNGSGNYSAVLEDTMELTLGKIYVVKVDIEGGGADDQRWSREVAKRRGFGD